MQLCRGLAAPVLATMNGKKKKPKPHSRQRGDKQEFPKKRPTGRYVRALSYDSSSTASKQLHIGQQEETRRIKLKAPRKCTQTNKRDSRHYTHRIRDTTTKKSLPWNLYAMIDALTILLDDAATATLYKRKDALYHLDEIPSSKSRQATSRLH